MAELLRGNTTWGGTIDVPEQIVVVGIIEEVPFVVVAIGSMPEMKVCAESL